MKKEKKIIVFNIENRQSDYARCLEIIKIFENCQLDIKDKRQVLAHLNEECNVTLIRSQTSIVRWLEQPIQLKGKSSDEARNDFDIMWDNRETINKQLLLELLQDLETVSYHIRVHMEFDAQSISSSSLLNLQYLALFLQRLEEKERFWNRKIIKKTSLFLVPSSAVRYPFRDNAGRIDTESHKVYSQYLQMVTKQYPGCIYGVSLRGGKVEITPLERHTAKNKEMYFPIITVNQENYEPLFMRAFSETDLVELEKILTDKRRKHFRESLNENPCIATPDFIVYTAMARCSTILGEDMKVLFDMIRTNNDCSAIQFCIFAFLLTVREEMQDTWKFAMEIVRGIRQVVQNAVQHSELRKCLFGFYLHQRQREESTTKFIKRMSREYPNIVMDSECTSALEIFVSDLNEKQDMLDSFSENLNQEIRIFSQTEEMKASMEAHKKLVASMEKVSIGNLFSEYSDLDIRKAWLEFRKEDLVAHVGLSLFSLTAERCRAALRVVSSKNTNISAERNFFYKSYGSDENEKVVCEKNHIIPGTQFSILVPIREWKKVQAVSLGQLDFKNRILENYSTFSKFLEYEEKQIPVNKTKQSTEMRKRYAIGNRTEKNASVMSWYKQFWKPRLMSNCHCLSEGKYVFNHDFSLAHGDEYFVSTDHIEVCLKGLLLALNLIDIARKPLYLALTNLPSGFIQCLSDLIILIGVRPFPQNVQIFLSEGNEDRTERRELILAGENYTQALYNAYILSIEHGVRGCDYQEYLKSAELYNKITPKDIMSGNPSEIEIFPFDVVLKTEKLNETYFEARIRSMVECQLDGDSTGYKLESTHMRLGSKVHIEAFYEMSFLFYRTAIANRIAFLILKGLMSNEEKQIDLKKDVIVFYGYASYSKAILTSVTEILKCYRKTEWRELVGFTSYQHNLQSDTNDIQMYFGLEINVMGTVNTQNQLNFSKEIGRVNIVQIVPISSTLTTFEKMWSEFIAHLDESSIKRVDLCANFTAFWVIDTENKKEQFKPSTIEAEYWENVQGKEVKTKFKNLKEAGCEKVTFFMHSKVVWHDPLKCKLCFPEYVIEEIPLVETDFTSTVPTQQIRHQVKGLFMNRQSEKWYKNIERLKGLEDCVLHGHLYRRQNHYQFYIDTQRYFHKQKGDIRQWLKSMREDEQMEGKGGPVLHIIFSPEHNTNVGFAQYVNTYYFGGMAEIISINVEKEYRSNFVCEHSALINMIQYLHNAVRNDEECPVRFYFVDDTIISGETFQKANSLLHSLIPNSVKEQYQANLFEKVFLLVDRMSNDSKCMYVNDIEHNFKTYVHIDVSNIRTQGDSCVGCKLEQNARKMFKRSATKQQATYWAKKIQDYTKISFDDLKKLNDIDRTDSYNRLIVTHILQNILVKEGKVYVIGDAYDTLLMLMEFLLEIKTSEEFVYKELLDDLKGLNGIEVVFKSICRPFFIFDYKIRLQVVSLFIFLSELLMGNNPNSILREEEKEKKKSNKIFLYEKERKSRTVKLAEAIKESLMRNNKSILNFLRDYLLEGLADMGSTYMMRWHTIKNFYTKLQEGVFEQKDMPNEVEEFWKAYALNLHRLLVSTEDETKELWLEYLYNTGMEYEAYQKIPKKSMELQEIPRLYYQVTGLNPSEHRLDSFYHFCMEIFLQNTRLNFDGIERISAIDAKDEYFMKYWIDRYKLEQLLVRGKGRFRNAETERCLFDLLQNHDEMKESTEFYKQFLELIAKVATKKYGYKSDRITLLLMTGKRTETENDMEQFDVISEYFMESTGEKSIKRYQAKERLSMILKTVHGKQSKLQEHGYFLIDEGEESYFIILFDNPPLPLNRKVKCQIKSSFATNFEGRDLRPIEPVFLYMSVERKERAVGAIGLNYMMRDILMYRNRILRILEKHFYGNTFSSYARISGEREAVAHERAASHSATSDDRILVESFLMPQNKEQDIYKNFPENERSKWLLLRSYTNSQIAKLFNRYYVKDFVGEIPPLYLSEPIGCQNEMFGIPLKFFGDLEIQASDSNEERRFKWFEQVVDFDILIDNTAEFVCDCDGKNYNLEYFKCILSDIFMSAIKFQSFHEDFLLRIKSMKTQMQNHGEKCCKVKIFREISTQCDVDYLVIENPVNKVVHNLADWEQKNRLIKMRLMDPLDFSDGHMSMITIKRYIENLKATNCLCDFRYFTKEENGVEELYFATRLPVLKKEK